MRMEWVGLRLMMMRLGLITCTICISLSVAHECRAATVWRSHSRVPLCAPSRARVRDADLGKSAVVLRELTPTCDFEPVLVSYE